MMTRAMMEEGEPFTQEEVDEMMAVAVDPESGNIPYEYYINQIMVNICYSHFKRLLLNIYNFTLGVPAIGAVHVMETSNFCQTKNQII